MFSLADREKPGQRMNASSKQLTQSTPYTPDNYRDFVDYGMAGQGANMKKSVSFNQRNGNGNGNGMMPVNGIEDSVESPQSSTTGSVSNGMPGGHKRKKDAASWYTRPVHLDIAFPSHSAVILTRPSAVSPPGGARLGKATNGCAYSPPDTNGMDAVTSPLSGSLASPLTAFADHTMAGRPTSAPAVSDPVSPPTNNGFLSPTGHSVAAMLSGIKGHRTASTSDHDKVTTSDLYMDALASEYFPLTFGLSKSTDLEGRQQPQTYNHHTWKHSSMVSSWRQPRRTKSPGRRRPGSAHSSSSSNSKSSIDRAHLMAVEAPAHGK